jgi:hypothetical protein
MTGLLDLPDELLIKILGYLQRPHWPFPESQYSKDQRRKLLCLNRRISAIVLAEWTYYHIKAATSYTKTSSCAANQGWQQLARDLSWEAPYNQSTDVYDAALVTLIQYLHHLSSVSIASYEPEDVEYLGRDPNLLPASLASLKQCHPSITRLRFVLSSFDLATALLENLPNLEEIVFETHYFPDAGTRPHDVKRTKFWLALCKLPHLRRLVWGGTDVMGGPADGAGPESWATILANMPAAAALSTLDFGEYDCNYGTDTKLFWQASAAAFPSISSLSIDALHMQYLADQLYFPKLVHLAVEDASRALTTAAPLDLENLVLISPAREFFESDFRHHPTLARLRIASSMAAFLLLNDDRCFPALRILTISVNSERHLLCQTPLVCQGIRMHCARRGIRLFEEVQLNGKDLLFEYTLSEIDCSGEVQETLPLHLLGQDSLMTGVCEAIALAQ